MEPRTFRSGVFVFIAALALMVTVAAQQAPDRSKAPVPGAAPALKLPPIQKRALANGLPVWIVEMHKVPLATFALVVKAGAATDPIGKYGLANFTAVHARRGRGHPQRARAGGRGRVPRRVAQHR